MNKEVNSSVKPLVMNFLQELMKNYWGPLYEYVKVNPHLVKSISGFLLNHENIIVYVGRTHIAVEYTGSEILDQLRSDGELSLMVHDYSTEDYNFFEKIIGFEYDSTVEFSMPLASFSEDLLFPTNRGWDKLSELGWNFAAQNSIMAFNSPCPEPVAGQFTRIVNGMFFDADEFGLKTRRIKWLDFFPINFDGSDEEVDSISFNLVNMNNMVDHDANYCYPMPDDYKFSKLPKINKFIEVWGTSESKETDITAYLSEKENKFILTMNFGARDAYSELTCEWQSEQRRPIRPDFFCFAA